MSSQAGAASLRGGGWLPLKVRKGVSAMGALRIDDFKQYSDVLCTREGEFVTLRFLEPGDAEELQSYFRSLSTRSSYNRLLGAMSELPRNVLDHFIRIGDCDEFSVIATAEVGGFNM